MKYTIKQKGEKYYKKFKPFGALIWVILITTWLYILFEVIRG
jgi:hypothetical protein